VFVFVVTIVVDPAGAECAPSGAMRADGRQFLGKMGEDLACDELARRGYEILERRYRTRYGEIDIVARSGPSLVFVEVKAREGREFGGGEAAVTVCKQQRIVRMAIDFLARRNLQDRPCRFDVVTIDFEGGRPKIEVYPHAFTA
jgi:putative endonuclease